LLDNEYRRYLDDAGFENVDLEVTRRYTLDDLGQPLPSWVAGLGEEASQDLVQRFASTFVRARKPL
jgi:hypothetical protein